MRTRQKTGSSDHRSKGLLEVLTDRVTSHSSEESPRINVALVGQPNAGKTSLFNRLTGLRGHIANYPGTTVEVKEGSFKIGATQVNLLDLPGLYTLNGSSEEQRVASAALCGSSSEEVLAPDIIVVVLDSTRLAHHLPLAGEILNMDARVIVVLNMIDEAEYKGQKIDVELLQEELGAPVVPISARRGTGIDDLTKGILEIARSRSRTDVPTALKACSNCTSCPITARCTWSDSVVSRVADTRSISHNALSLKMDKLLSSSLSGLLLFGVVMLSLFFMVFSVAAYPMEWIDRLFSFCATTAHASIPNELLASFVADGMISGIGGVLIFLPQICLLFFGISLLENSGYLARATVAVDRVMRRFGIPGQAFVPLLSAHACAIPAIMATRVIENKRDRLRTILIIPLLTCSARLPVYLMVATLLFGGEPLYGALVFLSGYVIGALAAIFVSLLLQRSLIPGSPSYLAIDFPPYRLPDVKIALYTALDRGKLFVKKAGTIVLFISLLLWCAATFPQVSDVEYQTYRESQTQSAQLNKDQYALERSFAGQVGHRIESVFKPLGFDWRISVGIVSSFAAREVIVSILSVISGIDDSEVPPETLAESLRTMKREDGSTLLDIPTSLSLFVFFILAMQCLPTQAITYRETGSWRWPMFQLVYMTALAYGSAFVVYQVSRLLF